MKKINSRFSLDALANKVELNKAEMQTIKGGTFTCYCNGRFLGNYEDPSACVRDC